MSILSEIEIHAVLEIFCFSLNAIDSDKIFHNHEKGNRYNPLCPAWIIVRTLYPPLRFPVLPQFIISLLEFHCLPANTTRPNKNVYCFSSTATTFLLFPSSAIIIFLLFPPPPPDFYCFPSATATVLLFFSTTTTTTILLFSRLHHHNSVSPAYTTSTSIVSLVLPPQFYYFSSSTTTTTTFPFLSSFFATATI